jgi:hypothetical protein
MFIVTTALWFQALVERNRVCVNIALLTELQKLNSSEVSINISSLRDDGSTQTASIIAFQSALVHLPQLQRTIRLTALSDDSFSSDLWSRNLHETERKPSAS